ncbi:hypothetical protein O181_054751 [Austropuccinia psidii MF-1]|uniref:Uncharacterized protein n=1 Tax=Austropuccinia psidii MF-1 TaxID=1389203 RepID=A0A9Q3HRF8_9BASI|nr:hypothetical protein [Austropuccinia psidii MF-1]
MTTRRGSQYSIRSDGIGLRSRFDTSKGKRKGKILSGKESTKGSAISQRQVPEIPILSEPELELKEEIVRYPNGWNTLSSKHKIKKIKEYHSKKREESKEEAPVVSTRKPQATQLPQEGKKNKKKNWRKPYSPSYMIPKVQKDAMDNVFNMVRTLMEFKDKEEQRMRQPHFPKK